MTASLHERSISPSALDHDDKAVLSALDERVPKPEAQIGADALVIPSRTERALNKLVDLHLAEHVGNDLYLRTLYGRTPARVS